MEETISLKELFQTLKKRIKLILSITIAATLLSGLVSFFLLTPIYESSTQILVNQTKTDQSNYTTGDIQTNLQLINTYNEIIKSPAILDIVSERIGGDHTTSTLNSKISVGSKNNSQIVTISAQDADPVLAANIANTTAEVFRQEITKLMNVDNVTIISPAQLSENPSPVKPNPVLNIAIALVVGLMAGVGLAFLLEYLDNTVKTEQDVENELGLPVLGSIAMLEEKDIKEMNTTVRSTKTRGEAVGS